MYALTSDRYYKTVHFFQLIIARKIISQFKGQEDQPVQGPDQPIHGQLTRGLEDKQY